VDNWPQLWPLTLATINETVIGFFCGAVLGVGLGVLLAKRRFAQRVIYPILVLSQAIPIIALAPPLVLVLGFNLAPKVVIVAWVVFFPVTVSVLDGLSNVDRDLLTLARAYGASPWRTFRAIEIPAASTSLFSGLKIGATYAVTGAIIGELAASSGSSLAMFQHAQSAQLDAAGVYGTTLIMTTIGIGWFGLVALVEFFTTPWKRRSVARRAGRHI
jgi:ABC-type nitrate/sulfonate/bicarbonate transport system permease component